MSRSDCIIFLGPSLPLAAARQIVDARYLPPATRGDVYRAAVSNPSAIVLIDGYFENAPAVFHKEILWALAHGIAVYGGASMGALRAAELDVFGMVGVGRIYEAYRDGSMNRDDAVAVLHGPAELGYPSLTVALVDIVATLDEAEREAVIDEPLRKKLEAIAAALFYKERDYERLLQAATHQGCAPVSLTDMSDWLRTNQRSQKSLDAEETLRRVAAYLEIPRARQQPSFYFEQTAIWTRLVRHIEGTSTGQAIEIEALVHVLAAQEATRSGITFSEHDLTRAAYQLRFRNRLWSPADVHNWLERTGISHHDYMSMLQDMCLLEVLTRRFAAEVETKKRLIGRRRAMVPPTRSLK